MRNGSDIPALTTGFTGEIANGLVGFGDAASFGLTHLFTSSLYPDVVCKITKSGASVAGAVAGTVAVTVATGGTGIASTGTRAAAAAAERAAAASAEAAASRAAMAAARTAEDAASAVLRTPSFIVHPNGDAVIVPQGATGPTAVRTGNGFQYTGGSGGFGLDSKTTSVRIMEPSGGMYPHPNGYVSYSNASGQAINPFTGSSNIAKNDPFWHWDF